MERCVRLGGQYFEKAPPPLLVVIVMLAIFEINLFLQIFFLTFICEEYTKQRLHKQLYLLDKVSYDEAHTLIRRILNYSKRLGTCEICQMAL